DLSGFKILTGLIFSSLRLPAVHFIANNFAEATHRHTVLRHIITVTNGDRILSLRFYAIKIDGNTKGRSGLILSPVALADGTRFIIQYVIILAQVVLNLMRQVLQLIFLDEWENAHLGRRYFGVQLQHGALISVYLLLTISIAQHHHHCAIQAN